MRLRARQSFGEIIMRKSILCALAVVGALSAGTAAAMPIAYVFTGTGTGTLGGTAFDGSFTVTENADTSTVTSSSEYLNVASSATFVSGSLSATLTGTENLVIDNPGGGGFIGFGQFPNVAVEAMTGAAFETYDLTTALPLTTGGLSVAAATFNTSAGDLSFASITALSFQAITGTQTSVPEPATLGMLGLGFAALGALGRRRRAASRTSCL
jgi:hypothetical protein